MLVLSRVNMGTVRNLLSFQPFMTAIIKFLEDICEVWTNKPSNLYEVLKRKFQI